MKPFAASFAAVLTTAFVLSACAGAGRPSPAPVFVLADSGYLSPEALARLAEAAPSAPDANSAADRQDRNQSDRFRALEQSDRWLLATAGFLAMAGLMLVAAVSARTAQLATRRARHLAHH